MCENSSQKEERKQTIMVANIYNLGQTDPSPIFWVYIKDYIKNEPRLGMN